MGTRKSPACRPTYQKVDSRMSSVSRTSDEILASARSFIIAGGYNAFSYADIAVVVGVRKASIHHHFPSKVDLVRSLVRQYREDAELGLGKLAANAPSSLAVLQLFAGNWEKCIEDASQPFCVCALLASELPVLPPAVALEVREYFRSLSGWLAGVMERGARAGELTLDALPRRIPPCSPLFSAPPCAGSLGARRSRG